MPFDPELQARIDAVREGLNAHLDMSELGILKRKLAARKDKPGFKDNCAEIERQIARLEANE